MDKIRIGLDFGTHQTKICVQRTPDEGHGEPNYEFLSFCDLKGEMQYFLPSIVQLNKDDTLSYGFTDPDFMKDGMEKPVMPTIPIESDFEIAETAKALYGKYATDKNVPDDLQTLTEMLAIRKKMQESKEKEQKAEALTRYKAQMKEYHRSVNIYRYFKQATFVGHEWNKGIPSKLLCVWYLAYIIFLLEEKFGQNFSINMGVPADQKGFSIKSRLAVEILASAYTLVEDIYKNDINAFLFEPIEKLKEKTKIQKYSFELKDEYKIQIFPEAYASLIGLTSKGKISEGMSLTADIGGGTTDISFFTINDRNPVIYRYWSIPEGLNYVAEMSGFDYSDGSFEEKASGNVIESYNAKKIEIVNMLIRDLKSALGGTGVPKKNLMKALENRVLVYSGGGSTFDFLANPLDTFSDVKLVDASIWKEENIKDKDEVSRLSVLLTTAYGLSMGKNDQEVKLEPFSSLFGGGNFQKREKVQIQAIDKDMC